MTQHQGSYASRRKDVAPVTSLINEFCGLIPTTHYSVNLLRNSHLCDGTSQSVERIVRMSSEGSLDGFACFWTKDSVLILQYKQNRICYRLRLRYNLYGQFVRGVFVVIGRSTRIVKKATGSSFGFYEPRYYVKPETETTEVTSVDQSIRPKQKNQSAKFHAPDKVVEKHTPKPQQEDLRAILANIQNQLNQVTALVESK